MNTKALRQRILDLAIHGKLLPKTAVEQCRKQPDYESAEKLLEKIRAEKAEKIKKGELKPSKSDRLGSVDNPPYQNIADGTPFEVPSGWAWCRLNELAEIARGGSPRPIEDFITESNDGINWIKIGDTASESKYIVSAREKIKPEGKKHSRFVHAGDFLLTNSMSFGRPYILKIDGCIHDGWLVFADIKDCVTKDFLYYALSSDYIYDSFSLVAAGSTVKNLKSDTVKQVLFPLPPLAEQRRIVTAIETIFAQIDALERSKADLQTAIKQAKSKILDLAIRGKLVPQSADDESAAALLERLAKTDESREFSERKLGKCSEGTRHNRHYAKINEDEMPFDIPASWVWCHLGEICDYGKCINVSTDALHQDDWILDLEDIEKDTGKIIAFHTFEERKSESTKHKFHKGQVLYSKLRPYLNKVVVAPKDGFCTSEILPLDFNCILESSFAQKILMSSYFLGMVNMVTYGVKMPRLGTDDAKKMLIPIPPLAEQHRIVTKIEELFAVLDTISAQIL